VTTLFVTQRLALIVHGQLQGVGLASKAALAELHAQGEHAVFNRRLVELTRLIAILAMTTLGPIMAFNSHFIARWLKPAMDGGDLIVLVAAINALLVAVCSLWLWVFTSTGQVGLCSRPAMASAVLNVAASLLFTRAFGLIGPILGTCVAYFAIQAWYLPLLLRRHFGIPIRALAWAVAAPVLAGVPYAAALWWLARGRPAPGWIGLAAEMGGSALAFLAFSAAVLLDPTDREIWRARLAGLLQLRPSRGEG
jgi:O-antigen/teichoic acid export membrane protein